MTNFEDAFIMLISTRFSVCSFLPLNISSKMRNSFAKIKFATWLAAGHRPERSRRASEGLTGRQVALEYKKNTNKIESKNFI